MKQPMSSALYVELTNWSKVTQSRQFQNTSAVFDASLVEGHANTVFRIGFAPGGPAIEIKSQSFGRDSSKNHQLSQISFSAYRAGFLRQQNAILGTQRPRS